MGSEPFFGLKVKVGGGDKLEVRKRAVREGIAEHSSKRGGDLRDIWTVTCMDRAQRDVVNAGKWICIDRSVVNIDMVGWRTCYHAVQCF